MRKTMLAVVASAAIGILSSTPDTSAANWVEIGLLKCVSENSVGMIITSKRDLDCQFEPSGDYPVEEYSGTFNRVGLDFGKTDGAKLVWAVLAPSYGADDGNLAGRYGGVSAEATIGYGLGANVLFGGFEKSIALQPVSLQSQTGIDIAVGVASLDLQLQ